MLSIEELTRILNKNGKRYDEEQVHKIRTLLHTLTELDYELSKKGGKDEE